MKCHRCHGMMAMEGIWTRQGKISVAHCLYCGNVVDPVVMANRSRTETSLAAMLEKEALEEKRGLQRRDPFPFSKRSAHRAA